MRTGIYVDFDNIARNGLGLIQFDVLRDFFFASGSVSQMHVYLGLDEIQERENPKYAQWRASCRARMISAGFKIHQKEVKSFQDDQGNISMKANVDVDLAVDVMRHMHRLDRVVLLTGDGDFVPLVEALQASGIFVQVLTSGRGTSNLLMQTCNEFVDGRLIPDLIWKVDYKIIFKVLGSNLQSMYLEVEYLKAAPKTLSPNDPAWERTQIKLTKEMFESKMFMPGKVIGWTGADGLSSYQPIDL